MRSARVAPLLVLSVAAGLPLMTQVGWAQDGISLGRPAVGSARPAPPAPPPSASASVGAAVEPAAPTPSTSPAGAPSAATAKGPDEPKPVIVADAAKARNLLLSESTTLDGGTGLLRTQHAQSSAVGQFRLGLGFNWFTSGFLCSGDYPCRVPGGKTTDSDTQTQFGMTLTLSVTVAEFGGGFLETYGSTSGVSRSSESANPWLLQVLGDTVLGAKWVRPVSRVVHMGGLTELRFAMGSGSLGVDWGSTGFRFGPLFTADFRGLEKPVPFRMSINASYSLDNTGVVVEGVEKSKKEGGRGEAITRFERFGLGINRVDHFDMKIGLETFLANDKVRPFLDWTMLVPVNRQDYACKPNNADKDGCLANETVLPSTLTIGSRFFPWKPGFSLLLAMDVGLSGTGTFIQEVAPTAPWTLHLGAGWATDVSPVAPEPKVIKSDRVSVRGMVRDGVGGPGIPNAIVSYEGPAVLSSLVTGEDGAIYDDVPAGSYRIKVKAEGYKPTECELKTGIAEKAQFECVLEALPKTPLFELALRDAATRSPLANATIVLIDAAGKETLVVTDAKGIAKLDKPPTGVVRIKHNHDGYLAQQTTTNIGPDSKPMTLDLTAKPKVSTIEVTPKEVVVKQQIQFAVDTASILPDSTVTLSEIVDHLLKTGTKLEIQGHVDADPSRLDDPSYVRQNRTLSQARADAVKNWLVARGVSADRLVARGYGHDKPVAPNVISANRAKNRRVIFLVNP